MAAASGRPDPSVEQLLFDAGYRFDFFQAVRLLRRLYPHRAAVGHEARPGSETVRFRSRAALNFAPSAIHEIRRGEGDGDDGQAQMTVGFMGLTGPVGILPRHYTTLLLERLRSRDAALHDFLDIFTHRSVSLFFRAWEKYRFAVGYERAHVERETTDQFAWILFDLIGMGTDSLLGRLLVDDRVLLYYTGLLSQRRRSASALAGLLQDHFGVPVRVGQFLGQWLTIPQRSRTRLGPRGVNHALGVGAIAGHRFWDQQAAFCVHIGPLRLGEFAEFLPTGTAFRPLVQLIRYFVGQQFDFDVELTLKAEDVPRCTLGEKGESGPRLGWSSWLKTAPFARDADDTRFSGDLTRLGALRD
jgi:type VI secretion system protein ImpH